MKTATIVRDKISGDPFAIIIGSGKETRVFGALGQGQIWAEWVEQTNSLQNALDTLDVSLVTEANIELSNEYIDTLTNSFSPSSISDIRHIASRKALLIIQQVKSAPEPENYEQINEVNEEEQIDNWPITDATLASIDVAYKQIVVDYKAKAFNLDKHRSSIILQVKGVRAIWDPDMPGGGGWRCPLDTPNGGQFTNRLGRGCTFGAMRRIGRSLMAASLRDISKGFDDAANVDLPTVYRAGRAIAARGDARDVRLQGKFGRRVARRADKLKKQKAKEQLKASAITWRQAYESLGPDMSRVNRAQIAAAQVASRIADDFATAGFNRETRRSRRRAGQVVEKLPSQRLIDPNNPIPIATALDSRISNDMRQNGGRLNSGISARGGLIDKDGQIFSDFDEMIPSKNVFYDGSAFSIGKHIIGKADDLPDFISMDEAFYIAGFPGDQPPDPLHMFVNGGKIASNVDLTSVQLVNRKKLDELINAGAQRSLSRSFLEFTSLDFPPVNHAIPKAFRDHGGRLPRHISNLGAFVHSDVINGNVPLLEGENVVDFDRLIPNNPKDFNLDLVNSPVLARNPDFKDFGYVSFSEMARVNGNQQPHNLMAAELSRSGANVQEWQYLTRDSFEKLYQARTGRNLDSGARASIRERMADRLRGTAANILEGQRMSRRRDRSPSKQTADQTLVDEMASAERRAVRGASPKRQGIITRFLSGESDSRTRERRQIERMVRGRTPKSTSSLRERAAMWQRRRALRLEGIKPGLEDYPQYAPTRIDYPEPKKPLTASYFINSIVAVDEHRVNPELRDDRVDPILSEVASPSGGVWWKNETAWAGLKELDKFFHNRASHARIGIDRENVLDDFDVDHQDRLREIYQEWLMQFNDPDAPSIEGSPSNLGFVTQMTSPVREADQPTFQSDDPLGDLRGYIDGSISLPNRPTEYRHMLFATNTQGTPAVYVEDTDAGVAHLLTPDGKHLMSMVIGDKDSRGKSGPVRFIAGSAAYERIVREEMKPTLRERLRGRFRARTPEAQGPATVRARRRQFERSTGRTGLSFGKTTTGNALSSLANLQDSEKESLLRTVKDNLDTIEASFRRRLNIQDPDIQLSEDAILDYVNELAKTDKRQAGILSTRLHDFITLNQIEQTGDLGYVNNLKPTMRERVLQSIPEWHIERFPKTRRNFVPYKGGASPSKVEIIPKAPLILNIPSTPPSAPVKGTGPDLTPGVGNPALGIVHDAASGLYIDSNTGLFIEDLSNLPIDQQAIYKPSNVDENLTFPEVQITPTGIFPAKFVRLAPGVDPNGPAGSGVGENPDNPRKQVIGISRSFLDAIHTNHIDEQLNGGKVSQATAAANRILGRGTDDDPIFANIVSFIDARGTSAAAATGTGQSTMRSYSIAEIMELANRTAASDDRFSELTGTYKRANGPDDSLAKVLSDNMANKATAATGDAVVDNLETIGINPNLPIGEFYLPSFNGSKVNNDLIVDINRALQMQHRVDTERARGTISANELQKLQDEADGLWNTAAENLSAIHEAAALARDTHLDTLQTNDQNKTAKRGFLENGQIVEVSQAMLERHIINNPTAMRALESVRRRELEAYAASKNARAKAAQERALKRASQGVPRNEGAFDNQPDILDPYSGPNPPAAPRRIDTILNLSAQHRTEGLFDEPDVNAPLQIADEQVDALDALGQLHAQIRSGQGITGIPGTPYDGVQFQNAAQAMLAHFWHYNGYNSYPILVSDDELIDGISKFDADGSPHAVIFTRGFKGSPAEQLQFSTDALSGDRFVPGQGGQVVGLGDYWSVQPGTWSGYHGGQGGTIIGMLTREQNLVNREAFMRLFGSSGGSPLYEAMWGLYNAMGAPSAPGGVNNGHGAQFQLLPTSSVLPDPATGLFTSAQIQQLQDAVDTLTAQGGAPNPRLKRKIWDAKSGWGLLTIESLVSNGSLPKQMAESLTVDIKAPTLLTEYKQGGFHTVTQQLQKEAQEQRAKLNAWFGQHLSWFVQLAQMRRDQSLPGQAGIDNRAYNEKLDRAMRSLLYMHPDVRAVMLGVDAYVADGVAQHMLLPSQVWQSVWDDRSGRVNANRIVVLNRSAMIYHRLPVRHFSDWTPRLQTIINPVTNNPITYDRGW